MKVMANYIDGKPATEIYKTGNDVCYNGVIYRLPDGPFEPVVVQSGADSGEILYLDGDELVVCLFVDNLEDLENTDRSFDEIPEGYYETCPVIEVEPGAAAGENSGTAEQ